MDPDIDLLERLYGCFNARDIDGVLGALAKDVVWANAMDGGYVHGPEAIRNYWTRQWALVSPRIEPVGYRRTGDDAIVATVRQSIRDLDGNPLAQSHGLQDKMVDHVFRLRAGKVVHFDVQDAG